MYQSVQEIVLLSFVRFSWLGAQLYCDNLAWLTGTFKNMNQDLLDLILSVCDYTMGREYEAMGKLGLFVIILILIDKELFELLGISPGLSGKCAHEYVY